jgi:hypothetical protein
MTFSQLQTISADPKATAVFYSPWTKCVNSSDAGKSCAKIEPIAAESE